MGKKSWYRIFRVKIFPKAPFARFQNKCGASSYHQREIVMGQVVPWSALRTFNTSQALNLEMKYQIVVCSNTDMKLFLKS